MLRFACVFSPPLLGKDRTEAFEDSPVIVQVFPAYVTQGRTDPYRFLEGEMDASVDGDCVSFGSSAMNVRDVFVFDHVLPTF